MNLQEIQQSFHRKGERVHNKRPHRQDKTYHIRSYQAGAEAEAEVGGDVDVCIEAEAEAEGARVKLLLS